MKDQKYKIGDRIEFGGYPDDKKGTICGITDDNRYLINGDNGFDYSRIETQIIRLIRRGGKR